jgi:hypothetical protein
MQSRDGAIHTNVDPSYFLPYNTYCHKIIKRKNGKYVKVVIDNLANFLSISPNQFKFFPSVCLVPSVNFCYFRFSLCGV